MGSNQVAVSLYTVSIEKVAYQSSGSQTGDCRCYPVLDIPHRRQHPPLCLDCHTLQYSCGQLLVLVSCCLKYQAHAEVTCTGPQAMFTNCSGAHYKHSLGILPTETLGKCKVDPIMIPTKSIPGTPLCVVYP